MKIKEKQKRKEKEEIQTNIFEFQDFKRRRGRPRDSRLTKSPGKGESRAAAISS